MAKRPKRPRDPMQLAKLIGDIASGERANDSSMEPKSPAPAACGPDPGTSFMMPTLPEDERLIGSLLPLGPAHGQRPALRFSEHHITVPHEEGYSAW